MKITKSRLKQIIKEELENIQETGFSLFGAKGGMQAENLQLLESIKNLIEGFYNTTYDWADITDHLDHLLEMSTEKMQDEAEGQIASREGYGSQWSVERVMDKFGDAGATADDERFKAALKASLMRNPPKSEEEAEDVYEDAYELFQQQPPRY